MYSYINYTLAKGNPSVENNDQVTIDVVKETELLGMDLKLLNWRKRNQTTVGHQAPGMEEGLWAWTHYATCIGYLHPFRPRWNSFILPFYWRCHKVFSHGKKLNMDLGVVHVNPYVRVNTGGSCSVYHDSLYHLLQGQYGYSGHVDNLLQALFTSR